MKFMWIVIAPKTHVLLVHTARNVKVSLKDIRRAITDIPVDMLERVEENFKKRVSQCIDNGGRHLADVIFKTV